jgi:PAP2 superfamily protein
MKRVLLSAVLLVYPILAHADAVTDWNLKAAELTVAGRLSPVDSWTVLATTSVAASDALSAISEQSPFIAKLDKTPDAAPEAAIAAANQTVLLMMIPSQKEAIDAAYNAVIAKLPEKGRENGIKLGTAAAQAVISARKVDKEPVEDYRPVTTPGKYVPTVVPAAYTASLRKCWVLDKPDQFRPGPPPELTSDVWARDYNEIKVVGAKLKSSRTPEQTDIAKFWETTNAIIYLPVTHAAANKDLAYNARFMAVVSMAVDDALGAVFDAKYTYYFWRPFTAIRNGDMDGNDATERDASWLPFIDTPMHPEYPCAHCIVSGTIGGLIKATVGNNIKLSTTSPTLPGKTRSWNTADEFMQEVALGRIYDGVHYRNSTEVGNAMGQKIGELAANKYLK